MQTIELDCIAVKGKKDGVKIYTILEHELGSAKQSVIEKHQTFLHDYRMRRWNNAISHANELIKHNEELKKYYEMMIDRIEELRNQKLPDDWDGVFRATSK